jgi:hypothetical protein
VPNTLSGCPTIWPIVCRGLSEPYGFWKMYWIRRRASLARWRAAGRSAVQARDRPGDRGLARPGLADQRQALVGGQAQAHPVDHLVLPVVGGDVLQAQGGLAGLAAGGHLDRVAGPALLPGQDELGADAAGRVVRPDRRQRRYRRLALLDPQRAARREAAAGRAAAGRDRVPGDADERPAAGQPRDRADQAPGVGVGGGGEQLVGAADLHHPAGVHDGDLPGQRRHHGQVVADVQGRDVVQRRELADGRQDVRLRGDVQAGGRLVEHDEAGPVGERHGEPDPLLLAAGQLVRVAPQERPVVGQRHLPHHLRDAPGDSAARLAAVRLDDLPELDADPQRRVQRRGRVLRDVGDQ